MDFSVLFNFLRLDVFVGLSGAVVALTALLKAIPVQWTTDKPKVVAWIATTIIIWAIGTYEGADTATMLTIIPVIALGAHGLYDVLKTFWNWLKK